MDCVGVNLHYDFSIEGDHTFTVQLNVSDEPIISTSGFTDIIIEDTNGIGNFVMSSVSDVSKNRAC